VLIVMLVLYLAPTDVTGRFDSKKAMATIDQNADERLDASEIQSVIAFIDNVNPALNASIEEMPNEHRDLFRVIDKDKDGLFSLNEKLEAASFLRSLDEDEDGFVSIKELK